MQTIQNTKESYAGLIKIEFACELLANLVQSTVAPISEPVQHAPFYRNTQTICTDFNGVSIHDFYHKTNHLMANNKYTNGKYYNPGEIYSKYTNILVVNNMTCSL